DAGAPDLLALQVETVDPRLAEEGVETFAVAGERARAVAVLGVVAPLVPGFGQHRLEVPGPEDGARAALDAHQVAHQPVHVALVLLLAVAGVTGQVNALAQHDRAGGARPGELRPPDDVLVGGPGRGQPGFAAAARAPRPPELQPVGADRRQRRQGGRSE